MTDRTSDGTSTSKGADTGPGQDEQTPPPVTEASGGPKVSPVEDGGDPLTAAASGESEDTDALPEMATIPMRLGPADAAGVSLLLSSETQKRDDDGGGDDPGRLSPRPAVDGFDSQEITTVGGGGGVAAVAAMANAPGTGARAPRATVTQTADSVDFEGTLTQRDAVSAGRSTERASDDESGPTSDPWSSFADDPVETSNRPRRTTPGNGRLAALVAQARAERTSGRHAVLENPTPVTGTPVTAPIPTATGMVGAPQQTRTAARSITPSAVVSLPQDKTPGFAATLMGLPAPNVQDSQRGDVAAWVAGEGDRTGRDSRDSQGLPSPAGFEDSEQTERNFERSGDSSRSAESSGRRFAQARFRVSESMAVASALTPSRRRRILTGAAVVVGVSALIIAFVAQRSRAPEGDERLVAPGEEKMTSPPSVASPAPPAANTPPPPTPGGAPAPVAAQAERRAAEPPPDLTAPEKTAAGQTGVVAGESRHVRDVEGASARGEKVRGTVAASPPSAVEPSPSSSAEAPREEVSRDEDSPQETKRRASSSSRAESRRAESGVAVTKKRRSKSADNRALRPETAASDPSLPHEFMKTKTSAPARGPENDPDATLPITIR